MEGGGCRLLLGVGCGWESQSAGKGELVGEKRWGGGLGSGGLVCASGWCGMGVLFVDTVHYLLG